VLGSDWRSSSSLMRPRADSWESTRRDNRFIQRFAKVAMALDPDVSTNQQVLPPLPREALYRIEQAEKDAKDRYERDKMPYFPTSPDFSFFERDILLARERILQYVRLFAEAILGAHIREYLEVEPLALLTNLELLKSVGNYVWTMTEALWVGYSTVLFAEPRRRHILFEIALVEGSTSQLDPSRYPDSEQWAESWQRLTESDSMWSRLSARFTTTIERVVADLIKQYQEKVASKLGVRLDEIDRRDFNQEEAPSSAPAEETAVKSQSIELDSDRSGTECSHADAGPEFSNSAKKDRIREPSPVALSKRDIKVHDVVGRECFRTMRNVEIMNEPSIRKRLRTECQLKTGDASKGCLDRIRHAMGYPLSREIARKRSALK
jgi:hypothetical protein